MRRAFALIGALAILGLARGARGADEGSAPAEPVSPPAYATTSAPASTPPPAPPYDPSALEAELARQAAAIERLKAAEVKRERERQTVRLSGYAQVDWVVHNQASVDEVSASTRLPLNQDRFTLRRGHVRVDSARGLLSGALEIDANTTSGAQVRPIDAEISLGWPAHASHDAPSLMLTVGLMRIPFGFEVPELDVERPFLERSTAARALFPGERDLGAQFRGRYRFLELELSAMNGHPLGDRVFPAVAPDRTKELVGHLSAHLELAEGVLLNVGASLDTGMGFHEGNPTTKDQLAWRDDNGDGIVQATEVQVLSGSSATPSQEFHRFALGGEARLALRLFPHGELALRAEVIRASNLDRGLEPADPFGAGYNLREFGWYLGATQELTSLGLIGVRYDRYNPDDDAREQQAIHAVPRDRSYSSLALLAMLRYDDARLALEYDRNGNALGRDANGAPTTLAADSVTVRAQYRF